MFSLSSSSACFVFVGLLSGWKLYMKVTSAIYHGKERLDGKTVIITGASAGIGAVTAEDLARRGARVVMLCRDVVKGENVKNKIISKTGNSNIVVKHLDLTSFACVRKCANEILNEEQRIDVLVNNAGASLPTFPDTEDGHNRIMQTNHFGPFLFTNILLDRIKQSAPSRIINVSSKAHIFAKLDLDHLDQSNTNIDFIIYSNTKLANIYFTNVLAEKLKESGVMVNSLHPGTVKTEINRNLNFVMTCLFVGILEPFFKNCWEGAQSTIMLSASSSVANMTGKYFSDCKETCTSKAAKDYTKALQLWDLSEKAVGLTNSERHY